jgi:hypothetical protein
MAKIIKQCLYCKKDFPTDSGQINSGGGKFCCVDCFIKYRKENHNVQLVCGQCGKIYNKIKALEETSKFCCKECMSESRKLPKDCCLECGKELSKIGYKYCNDCKSKGDRNSFWKGGDILVKCKYCGEEFLKTRGEVNRRINNFCNKTCESNWRSENIFGEKCHTWKGGVTEVRDSARNSRDYRLWRKECFEREDYTCEICNIRGGHLEVHHIKPFSLIMDENKINSLDEAKECVELWDINNGQVLCLDCHNTFHSLYGKTKFTKDDYDEFLSTKKNNIC